MVYPVEYQDLIAAEQARRIREKQEREERERAEQRRRETESGVMPKPEISKPSPKKTPEIVKSKVEEIKKKTPPIKKEKPVKTIDSKDIVPSAIIGPEAGTDKTTASFQHDEQTYKNIGYDVQATYEMKRFGKSFIPGWLTAEDWKDMSTLDRVASIAGDVGATILIVLSVTGALKSIAGRRVPKPLKGTFSEKWPGVKYYTMDDLNQAIKDMKVPGRQKTALLKNTVDIKTPVETPLDVAIVKEGPVGVKFMQGTVEIKPPPKTPGGGKASPKPAPGLPVKGGGSAHTPTTATMTVDQLLKELGITQYTVITSKALPVPVPKRGKKEKQEPGTKPIPKPETQPDEVTKPETDTGTKPGEKTRTTTRTVTDPGPGSQPGITPAPVETGQPEPVPVPVPAEVKAAEPEPGIKPAPVPTPVPSPTPVPKTTAKTKPPVIVPIKVKPLSMPADMKERRKLVKQSQLAIGWRMGELHGKSRYDVITDPFTNNERYLIILGRKPQGLKEVRGPRSAYNSAQRLSGHVGKAGIVDIPGIMHARIWPLGDKNIGLKFQRDANISSRKVFPLEKRR